MHDMCRQIRMKCPICQRQWAQDWEEPDCCPRCGWPCNDDPENEPIPDDEQTIGDVKRMMHNGN